MTIFGFTYDKETGKKLHLFRDISIKFMKVIVCH